jgi:alpha-glucan phosphorylase-like protein
MDNQNEQSPFDDGMRSRLSSLHDQMDGLGGVVSYEGFCERIGKSWLTGQITCDAPWAYFSQEVYRNHDLGLKGEGGLGILAGDISAVAEKLSIPMVIVTPFYSKRTQQALFDFWESAKDEMTTPEAYGFRRVGEVILHSKAFENISIGVYGRLRNSVRTISLYEPNIGQLYQDESNSNHRLYQEVVGGMGGFKALKLAGINPSILHLNESATVLSAVAMLDDLVHGGLAIDEALLEVRQKTIYTNHTLLPAAEGVFDISQFEDLVFPNLAGQAVIDWVRSRFSEGKIRMSMLAVEIAGRKNGVSKLHAKLSSQNYFDHDGYAVDFSAVTNGIADRWIYDEYLNLYKNMGVFDEFGLVGDDYLAKLEDIDIQTVTRIKHSARRHMNAILSHRMDQWGRPIHLPEDAIVFDYKRRLVSYKRFDMIFQDLERLAQILVSKNAYLLFSGRPHFGDSSMYQKLHDILWQVDNHPVLRGRVRFIQNYDEEVGLVMAIGADCAINVPIVGQEACGTSWIKDISNCKLLISTTDGGVADVSPASYLEVASGASEPESDQLYRRMENACRILRDSDELRHNIIEQLQAYISIVSGARMLSEYLDLRFEVK